MFRKTTSFIHSQVSWQLYSFWPDFASSHYSKYSLNWMDEYVNYVDKESNPPNVPQAQPIEIFWLQQEFKLQQSKS